MEENKDTLSMNLNRAIITIRCELQRLNLKKSGKNKFAGFEYFELSDFLPALNDLMNRYGINDVFSIHDGYAWLTLVKADEKQEYCIPFTEYDVPLNSKGQPSMARIQNFGSLLTYIRRYLYLSTFGITDGDVFDAMDNTSLQKDTQKKAEAKQAMDLPIGVEEAKNLESLIKNAKGDSPYEERLEMCLRKVGAADIADLKQSQYNYLVGILMKGQK